VKRRPLTGFRRENGAVGIRNHTVILPVDDLSNTAAEAVAKLVPGTLALPHAYGRLQFGADLDLTFATLAGSAANPNVASAVVIGIEPNWTERLVAGIAKTGKKVAGFSIERHGDLRTVERAARIAARFLQDDSECVRVPVERHEILLSIKCGESDTTSGLGSCPATAQAVDRWVDAGGTVLFGETSELTGGEHLIAGRCATDAVRAKFQAIYDRYLEMIGRAGADLLGSQPTQGNIRGGLSTIEEKAMGNIAKTGSRPVVGALEAAEVPASGPGLYFMDLVGRGRVHHPDGRGRRGAAPVPHRPGQRDRAPGRAGDQADREPADRADHDRAHRPGLFRAADQAVRPGHGGRSADGGLRPDHQRPPHLRRGDRPPRVRPHPPVPGRLTGADRGAGVSAEASG
jgi:(2R)-sulfolactate sulfo-lyase subunit beta